MKYIKKLSDFFEDPMGKKSNAALTEKIRNLQNSAKKIESTYNSKYADMNKAIDALKLELAGEKAKLSDAKMAVNVAELQGVSLETLFKNYHYCPEISGYT